MSENTSQLDYERIRLLYASMNRVFVGGALLVLYLSFILKEYMQLTLVVAWASITLALYIPRFMVTQAFNRKIRDKHITHENVLPWERYWIMTTLPFLASFSSLLYYPIGVAQVNMVAAFLLILSTGSILSYATSFKSIIAAFIVIYIPLTAKYFIVEGESFAALGFFYIVVVAVFISYSLSLHRTLIENIQLKIDNEQHALQDPLTLLWNRRGLYLHLDKITPRVIRSKGAIGVVLFDIDHFKKYNDTHGHSAGDDTLIKVANCINDEVREADLVVRYGGEEILAVMPELDAEQLEAVTRRILQAIRAETDVTVSAGLAVRPADVSIDELIDIADKALYVAKDAGRDQYYIGA